MIYVWKGLPTQNDEPLFALSAGEAVGRLSSDGTYLAAVSGFGPGGSVMIYRVADFTAPAVGSPALRRNYEPAAVLRGFNLPGGVLVANGHLFVGDTGFGRAVIWSKTKDDDKGEVKVVMTGSASDPPEWQEHIRNKPRREALANRFRDPTDPFRIVIVRDMWLTGFDCPSLHTMYIDKPMRGHCLMQAIARVNRVFKDKPGGLVVDYLGLAHELKAALATYTESGGTGQTAIAQTEAVAVMKEKYEICCDLFHGFDRSRWTAGTPQERLGLLPAAQEHILRQENGKDRFLRAGRELSQSFALAVPHEEAIKIRDDVAFFQAVQAALVKRAPGDARPEEELDHAVRQILSRAVAPEGVVDIFAAAGLRKPDISILSDEFLAEVRGMSQRNLAVELLQKLLKGEISTRRRKNVVQARSFAEMLEQTIRRYQNRAIEAAQVIEELIQLAKQMREADARGAALGLSEDELAFYDALETNDSAVKMLGDETLRGIARQLVETVRHNVTVDWTLRENVRAQLRVLVKRILRKHGYPPDKQEKATQTVLEQTELFSAEWAGGYLTQVMAETADGQVVQAAQTVTAR